MGWWEQGTLLARIKRKRKEKRNQSFVNFVGCCNGERQGSSQVASLSSLEVLACAGGTMCQNIGKEGGWSLLHSLQVANRWPEVRHGLIASLEFGRFYSGVF